VRPYNMNPVHCSGKSSRGSIYRRAPGMYPRGPFLVYRGYYFVTGADLSGWRGDGKPGIAGNLNRGNPLTDGGISYKFKCSEREQVR
jgi:hypothetical protein